MTRSPKTCKLEITYTPEDFEALERLSAQNGMSKQNYIRMILNPYIQNMKKQVSVS